MKGTFPESFRQIRARKWENQRFPKNLPLPRFSLYRALTSSKFLEKDKSGLIWAQNSPIANFGKKDNFRGNWASHFSGYGPLKKLLKRIPPRSESR